MTTRTTRLIACDARLLDPNLCDVLSVIWLDWSPAVAIEVAKMKNHLTYVSNNWCVKQMILLASDAYLLSS